MIGITVRSGERWIGRTLVAALALILLAGCQAVTNATPRPETEADTEASAAGISSSEGALVVYSGRSQNLVQPIIEKFEAETGINVEVRYGSTAEMAATILEEGKNSPADVFFAQDAGALGALAKEGRLRTLPQPLLDRVEARFRSDNGEWVGISGRARVLAYNKETVQPADLPADVYGLTDPAWQGKVAWAPTNGSFQSFVTAMRLLDGEEKTRQWLEDMMANGVQAYENNDAIVAAVGSGEIAVGLVNHYYVYEFQNEYGGDFGAEDYFFPTPGAGSIINVAGMGILDTVNESAKAEAFIDYMLSVEAQSYYAAETMEYPLAPGAPADARLKPLAEIATPSLDLSNLDDLQGTLQLLQETGAMQ